MDSKRISILVVLVGLVAFLAANAMLTARDAQVQASPDITSYDLTISNAK